MRRRRRWGRAGRCTARRRNRSIHRTRRAPCHECPELRHSASLPVEVRRSRVPVSFGDHASPRGRRTHRCRRSFPARRLYRAIASALARRIGRGLPGLDRREARSPASLAHAVPSRSARRGPAESRFQTRWPRCRSRTRVGSTRHFLITATVIAAIATASPRPRPSSAGSQMPFQQPPWARSAPSTSGYNTRNRCFSAIGAKSLATASDERSFGSRAARLQVAPWMCPHNWPARTPSSDRYRRARPRRHCDTGHRDPDPGACLERRPPRRPLPRTPRARPAYARAGPIRLRSEPQARRARTAGDRTARWVRETPWGEGHLGDAFRLP